MQENAPVLFVFHVFRRLFLCPLSPQLFLPSMRKKSGLSNADGSEDGDTLTAHWLVDDMFGFENVGFTKDVGRIKYLICADCEIGPIGWHCLDDKKKYYVALDRVNHEWCLAHTWRTSQMFQPAVFAFMNLSLFFFFLFSMNRLNQSIINTL